MTERERVKQTAKDVILSLEALSAVKRKAVVVRPPEAMTNEWRNQPPDISAELRDQNTRLAELAQQLDEAAE